MKKICTFLLLLPISFANAQIGNTVQLATTDVEQQTFITIDFEGDWDMDIITSDGAPSGFGSDLIAVSAWAMSFYLIENEGAGNFSSQFLFSLTEPVLRAFGDINNVDLVDFFSAPLNSINYNSANEIYCRMNLGNGSFATQQLDYIVAIGNYSLNLLVE